MKKMTSIKLERAEGTSEECIEVTVTSWDDADLTLARWAHTAPCDGKCGFPHIKSQYLLGGYNKCDFLVTFEDGETYEGRFDLTHKHMIGVNLLQKQMLNHMRFHALQWTPPHMTRAEHERYINETMACRGFENIKKEAEDFLKNYEIPV
jgi:hypothetical protein